MISGIILASGFSRRMKKDKLLLEVQGEKIIERVIKACVKSNLDRVILIYRKEEVKLIGEKYNIETIYNERAYLGQSESMKLGIRGAGDSHSYMFFVGDQPFLTVDLINKLIGEYIDSKSSILIPYYNGNRGMPVIISSKYKEDLLKVEGDTGGRQVVNDNLEKSRKVYIDNLYLGIDIDTAKDLESL